MRQIEKFSRAVIAIALMLGVWLPTHAHDFEDDGIYYNYIDKTAKTVAVTYRGTYYDSYNGEYTGSVTIPSSVTYCGTTYSVTSIGNYAFSGCTGLTSVTIPNSVTTIGVQAFFECTGLTSVTIPNSVTKIGEWAFCGCTGLTSVTIGNSVTTIGFGAFYQCDGLTSVTIPNSVTTIGDCAFEYCTGLTSVTIPNSVTTIGADAFYDCYRLTEVAIPNSVTTIRLRAFSKCTGLTSVTIGNSVTTIGDYAFDSCTGLTSVTIPNSVTTIGERAFSGCSGLKSIIVESGNTIYDSRNSCNAIIATSTNTLITGCKNTIIPNTVTTIGDYAFHGFKGLTSVVIPNSVTKIGEYAFYGCEGLASVSIPNSVTTIGERAFNSCYGLTEVTIGNSVTTIGDNAFGGCFYLMKIISLNSTPPTCASSSSFYSNSYSSATVYVPKDSYAKYFIDDVWGKFANIQKIETLVSSIKLNNTTIELDKGETTTLSATVSPSNATIKDIIWESANPQVAMVDKYGEVTALSAGTATITATAIDGSGVSASCNVVVKSVETKITLLQTEANLPVNEIMTLTYTVTPSNTPVEWSTSNQNVAYIKKNADNSVTVVGKADGEAIITATATDGSGASASCKITVIEAVANFFKVEDLAVRPGSIFTLPVELENADAVTGFQCNIYLPEGVEFVMVDDEYDVMLSSRATSSHTLSSALQSDGSLLILVYSLSSKAFKENSGELFSVSLKATDDYEGTRQITVSKIKVATQDAKEYALPDVLANIEEQSYIMGDANGDGSVSVGDIVLTANYILGTQSPAFVFAAADMSCDGQISIGDIVAISNVILSGSLTSLSSDLESSRDCVTIEDLSIAEGETKLVSINISNADEYTAFQMDVNLPRGLVLKSAILNGQNESKHNLMHQMQDNGALRLVSFSCESANFSNAQNALLQLEVMATNEFNGGNIEANNIILAKKDMNEYVAEDCFSYVTMPSSIDDVYGKTRIYVEANNIVIETPNSQVVSVATIDGRGVDYAIEAGKNIIPVSTSGMYIVKTESIVEKVIVK